MDEAGVDVWAVKQARSLGKMEPSTAEAHLRNLLTYLYWSDSPILTQTSLLDGNRCFADVVKDFIRPMQPSDNDVLIARDDIARQQGYDDALHGGTLDSLNRRYPAGSSQAAAAMEGFKAGEAFIAGKAVPKLVSGAKKPRGRRAKAEDDASLKPQAEPEVGSDSEKENAIDETGVHRELDDGDEVNPTMATEGPMVDYLRAEKMTKGELVAYFNEIAERWGQRTIFSLESRAVGMERLKTLVAKIHAQIRSADAAKEKASADA